MHDPGGLVVDTVALGLPWPTRHRCIPAQWSLSAFLGLRDTGVSGFLVWLVAIWFLPNLAGDMLGLIACLVTILVVTVLTQKLDPPRPLLAVDGEEVAMKDRLDTLPLFRSVK
jgi:hypothetical protein